MKLLKILLAIVTLGISLIFVPVNAKPVKINEDYFTNAIIESNTGFTKGPTKKGFRVDVRYGDYVVEVDWSHKVYEGIGQALVYSYEFDSKPGLLLLHDVSKPEKYGKYIPTLKYLGIKTWIVSVDKKNGKVLGVNQL